jgi:tetratricopeptide (TPR) repeat protein
MQPKPQKICFVAQPFGDPESPEREYFTTLYEDSLIPVITHLGYEVRRGDSYPGAGEILSAIIQELTKADLVVADLTLVNPNVFYELGVRHALRGLGTIMIVNRSRTPRIPFDLANYRVIEFDDSSFAIMQRKLREYIEQFEQQSPESDRDNPVHATFQILPSNVIAAMDGTLAGDLQLQLSQVRETLRRYRENFGELPGESTLTPLEIANQAAVAANAGKLPDLIMDEARHAAESLDLRRFVTAVQSALNLTVIPLSADQFYDLAVLSQRFDLANLTTAIYEEARRYYPSNLRLLRARLSFNSRSTDLAIRHQAQQDLIDYLHIVIQGDTVVVPDAIEAIDGSLVGILLDSYNGEGNRDRALQIIEAYYYKFPDRTVFARNYGRQLQYLGRNDEALKYYQQALWCSDVNDTTAIWLGSEFYNRQRYVDSAETYCLACILDRTDANGFANTADAITQAITSEQRANILGLTYPSRRLPPEINAHTVATLLLAAVSCELLTQENLDLCNTVGSRVGLDIQQIAAVRFEGRPYTFRGLTLNQRMDESERMKLAQDIYVKLRSPATARPQKMGSPMTGGDGALP